jgi:hypothetical protein
MDSHAKYDQKRRGCESRVGKYKFKNNPHLAVDRARGIKSEHIEGYGDEGEHACEGVYLRGWIISTKPQDPMQRDRKKRGTDPYCPPVRAMPSDDTPFIIESD